MISDHFVGPRSKFGSQHFSLMASDVPLKLLLLKYYIDWSISIRSSLYTITTLDTITSNDHLFKSLILLLVLEYVT
jgi:hypothetical protein